MLADMLVCDVLCELMTLLVMPFCCLTPAAILLGRTRLRFVVHSPAQERPEVELTVVDELRPTRADASGESLTCGSVPSSATG